MLPDSERNATERPAGLRLILHAGDEEFCEIEPRGGRLEQVRAWRARLEGERRLGVRWDPDRKRFWVPRKMLLSVALFVARSGQRLEGAP